MLCLYSECQVCSVSQINPLWSESLCWMSLGRMSLCWVSWRLFESIVWAFESFSASVCTWQTFLAKCNVTLHLIWPICKLQKSEVLWIQLLEPYSQNFILLQLTNWLNKLECLSLANLSSQVPCNTSAYSEHS